MKDIWEIIQSNYFQENLVEITFDLFAELPII